MLAPPLSSLIPLLLLLLGAAQALAQHGQQVLQAPPLLDDEGVLDLSLRQIVHLGGTRYPGLHKQYDVAQNVPLQRMGAIAPYEVAAPQYRVKQRPLSLQRLRNRTREALDLALDATLDASAWTLAKVAEPNITDQDTVLSFAQMANDAYYLEPGQGDWKDIHGGGFNYTQDFGWQSDGLRGHVFADTKNKTVVIAMKGTSAPFVDPRGTITNDKLNDNLLFSCCCGQGGRWLWHQVCTCMGDYQHGNKTCLSKAIREKTGYYHLARDLYHNVTEYYPKADIWLAGHSLGGSVASLLGLTVGSPVVTFEAPADAMAAGRLGLPTPPGFQLGGDGYGGVSKGVYHFGHTADDIFMGKCNAAFSICTLAGYAMESKCHTGSVCTYDTVKDLNWTSNARHNHGIGVVIEDVIKKYKEPPACKPKRNCRDCEDWKFS